MTFNTLDSVMALILCYFTKFIYNVVLKQLLGLPRFQNLLLIVYDHINTICAIIQPVFWAKQEEALASAEAIASASDCSCLRPCLLVSFL